MQGGLTDETPHILCKSSRKYSLYFSLRLLPIHRLTLCYTESSRDVFHLSYAGNGRTIMHRFHFSISSRMFGVFARFKGKIDSIKICVGKCWVAVRLRVWTVICILSSGWIMVRLFRWIKITRVWKESRHKERLNYMCIWVSSFEVWRRGP